MTVDAFSSQNGWSWLEENVDGSEAATLGSKDTSLEPSFTGIPKSQNHKITSPEREARRSIVRPSFTIHPPPRAAGSASTVLRLVHTKPTTSFARSIRSQTYVHRPPSSESVPSPIAALRSPRQQACLFSSHLFHGPRRTCQRILAALFRYQDPRTWHV